MIHIATTHKHKTDLERWNSLEPKTERREFNKKINELFFEGITLTLAEIENEWRGWNKFLKGD